MTAALARGVANLLLRASCPIQKRCAQPVKHPDPYLAISCAAFRRLVIRLAPPPHRAIRLRGSCLAMPRVDSVAGS